MTPKDLTHPPGGDEGWPSAAVDTVPQLTKANRGSRNFHFVQNDVKISPSKDKKHETVITALTSLGLEGVEGLCESSCEQDMKYMSLIMRVHKN